MSNGVHKARLDSIDTSLVSLHEKVDILVNISSRNSADIAWLKWGFRASLVALLGLGGAVAASAF